MKRALWIVVLLAGQAAADDQPDPRALFKDARYDAAAAGFEHRFAQDKQVLDGLNAVIAWRAAGNYAHARILLRRVRPLVKSDDKELVSRVELLDRKMAELTGTIVFTNLPAESIVTIDGQPAESDEGEKIVDVGIREILVSHPGCEPRRQSVALLPDQRVTIDGALSCAANNGNLHVHIHGIGADAYVDGELHNIATRDLDLPIAPGSHHLVVRRLGVTFEDSWVDVPERGTAKRDLEVPYRARKVALIASGVTGAVVGTDGEGSTLEGFGVGAVLAMDAQHRSVSEIEVDFGAGQHHHVQDLDREQYIALLGAFRFAGPLWQRRFGRVLLTLDVDPISVRMISISKGSYINGDNVFKQYLMFGSTTFGVDYHGAHAEIVAWPGGVATWGKDSLDAQRVAYCGSLMLALTWVPLGI